MSYYELITIVILLGLFLIVVWDSYQSAKTRRFYRKGYLEESHNRKMYRRHKLELLSDETSVIKDWYKLVGEVHTRFNRIDKDLKAENLVSSKEFKDLAKMVVVDVVKQHKTKLSGKTKKIVVDKTKKKK
jgi:hypothetical protein